MTRSQLSVWKLLRTVGCGHEFVVESSNIASERLRKIQLELQGRGYPLSNTANRA